MPPRAKAKDTRIGVIYARYSSHNQKEESIEQQVEACTAFAALNGINIVRIYADKALSGRTDKRPQFQKMLRDAEKRQFAVVIAYKSNRIARDMLNALKYEDKLGKYGIETLYAKEEFGNTAAGRFALRTMMNVNQFYSENMAEDIRRGMRDNAENCKVNGSLPLGYVKGPDGKYAVKPDEADIVREVYTKVLDDVPFVDIANALNSRGIKTKTGALWNKNSFRRMLTNDVYIGVYRHSDVVIEDGVPPIITKEMFFKMQEHLKVKKKPQGRHGSNNDYILTGKLYCGHCGALMTGVSGTGRNGGKHYYYSCNTRRTDGTCTKEHVRQDYIEGVVAELTKKFILQDEVIDWIADGAMNILLNSDAKAELRELEAELAETRKSIKNVMSAIEQGIITPTTKDRLLELEADAASIERSIAVARAAEGDEHLTKQHIIWHLQSLKDKDPDDKAFQKELISSFVKSVFLWDDKIEIDYYYTGKNHLLTRSLTLGSQSSSAPHSVLITSPKPHHKRLIRTTDDLEVVIYLSSTEFALLCPLSACLRR